MAMAEASKDTTDTANTAVPAQGDHDRVVMLSLRADGTPDQHNPELIGDKEAALAATREQFRQQAVSAADAAARAAAAGTGAEEVGQDPTIAELQQVHESVAKDAEAAADQVVDALHSDDAPAPAEQPAPADGGKSKSAR